MAIPSDYVEIAKEIMVVGSNIDRTPFVIERHAKISSDNKGDFYTRLIAALTQNETFKFWVSKKNEPITVTAACNGKILSINRKAKNSEPYIVLDFYVLSDKPKPKHDATDEEIREYLLNSDYPESLGYLKEGQARHYRDNHFEREIWYSADVFNYSIKPNGENYFTTFLKKENDLVKKGDIIAVVEDHTYSPEALSLMRIYEIAEKHCTDKLLELKEATKIKPPSFDPETTLDKIWIADFKKFSILIKKLKQEYRETGQSFVSEIDGELYWNIALKGSQKYLMGLLYICNEMKFININKYKDVQLITICKNTFNLEKIDPGNFPIMRGGKIGIDYEAPFIEYCKHL